MGDDATRTMQCDVERSMGEEDGEREVPGRDRRDHAAAAQAERVGLAGRAWQATGLPEQAPPLRRVVAQEIDRLAQLGEGVVETAVEVPDIDEVCKDGGEL